MTFLSPSMLLVLLTVPVLVLAYILALRRRKKYAVQFGSLLLMKQAVKRGPGWRRHIPPLLFLLALIVLMIALARPVAVVTLPTREGTVILVMDVSGSMQADDIKPNRLEASKAAARAFVDKEPEGVRIGIVSFSDSATLVQAPTGDRTSVIAAINRLRPQRSTAIGRGLLTAVDSIFAGSDEEAAFAPQRSFGQPQRGGPPRSTGPTPFPTPSPTPLPKGTYIPAIVVLLTDGENNQYPPPMEIIDQVANRGVRVYTVGLGSPEGTVLTNQGRTMRTRLDEATLKKIADATDGKYYNASSEQDLRSIYENLALTLVMRAEKQEITFILAAVGIVILLVAGSLSLLWFNRVP